MKFLAVVVVLVMIAWIVTWLLSKLQPPRCSSEQIQALTEALYQIGYDDEKAGRPEKSWDMEGYKPDRLGKEIQGIVESAYRLGRQDALEEKPSVAEKLKENREQRIRILQEIISIQKEITATLKEIETGAKHLPKS
jgi:hypothetical protein